MGIELSKQKIAFIKHQEECSVKDEERKAAEHFFKQQEKAQRAEEHICKHQEELRKPMEHRFKQQEEARKAREHIFQEWEHIQINIRELSKALGSETMKC